MAEIGIANGASAEMWEEYFTHPESEIHMFDNDAGLVEYVKSRVPSERLRANTMNVAIDGDVSRALRQSSNGELYDVIIDDSSHNLEHQIRIVKEAMPFIKPGGMLIIEDIFKSTADEAYLEPLKEQIQQCAFAYFVQCEHTLRWSPGWDNDKLLVLVKH
jgi:predicted O-methyltransferase YrrM